MRKLLVVQPYVPQYRVPFFDGLDLKLREDDIELAVVAGFPRGAQRRRRDTAVAPWLKTNRDWALTLRGITLTHVGRKFDFSTFDAVIAPAAGTSVDAYRAIHGRGRRNRKVGLWGHIGSYVSPASALDLRLERWQMMHADRVFAYTSGGARVAARAGVNPERITTVMNSVDVSGLVGAAVDEEFSDQHQLKDRKVFAFWGGLDESKRISFLAEVLDHLWASDRSIHLLVGGRGDQESFLRKATARGQVTMLGFITSRTKRSIAVEARAVLMPGRIGLIAVECLAVGLPVITTDWPYHAPEFEYLVEGDSVEITPNDPSAFADRVLNWQSATTRKGSFPTLDRMVINFAEGVGTMLGTR